MPYVSQFVHDTSEDHVVRLAFLDVDGALAFVLVRNTYGQSKPRVGTNTVPLENVGFCTAARCLPSGSFHGSPVG